MLEFKDKLVSLRKSLGYKQKDFALILGLTPPHLSEIEKGKKNPGKALLAHLKFRYPEVFDEGGQSPAPAMVGEPVAEFNAKPTGKLPHEDLVKHFRQADLAWEINWDLLKLEMLKPDELEEVKKFIKFRLSTIQTPDESEEKEEGAKKGTA